MSTTDPASLQFIVEPLEKLIASLPSKIDDSTELKQRLSDISVIIQTALRGASEAAKVVTKTAEAVCAKQELQQTTNRAEQRRSEQKDRFDVVLSLLILTMFLFVGGCVALGCGAAFAAQEWLRISITLTVSWSVLALAGLAFLGRRRSA